MTGNRKPQPQAWMAFPIGRSGLPSERGDGAPEKQVRAELYLSAPTPRRSSAC